MTPCEDCAMKGEHSVCLNRRIFLNTGGNRNTLGCWVPEMCLLVMEEKVEE
jgi:hypothetical protein